MIWITKTRRFSIPAAADEGDAVSGRIEVFVLTAHARDGTFVAVGRDTKMLREIVDGTAKRLDKDLKSQPAVEADLR